MSNRIHELILQEWIASLKQRDRSKDGVTSNFEDLFIKLKQADASFEEAHDLLPRAISAHYPSNAVAKNIYKIAKNSSKTFEIPSEKEFIRDWHKSIEDKGTAAFFDIFPLPRLDEDDAPKVFGSMSEKEYRHQRRHAEEYPTLDTTELEKRLHEQKFSLDIEDMLKHVLGDEKNG